MKQLSVFLFVGAISILFPFVSFADDISVLVNGTTYVCDGDGFVYGCECEYHDDRNPQVLRYYKYSIADGNKTLVQGLKWWHSGDMETIQRECRESLRSNPLCNRN